MQKLNATYINKRKDLEHGFAFSQKIRSQQFHIPPTALVGSHTYQQKYAVNFVIIFICSLLYLCQESGKKILSFFFVVLQPNAGHGLLILEVSRSHTMTHHSRQDSSGRVISPSQRPLPDNTQYSTQTDIHASGRIQNHNPSKRAAVDPCLRPRSH